MERCTHVALLVIGACFVGCVNASPASLSVVVRQDEFEPLQSGEAESTPGMAGANFNYNCGGEVSGDFMADPVEWVVGETATFEIPTAVIGGAEKEIAPIYKSHRYGLLGSTWGYDIPLETPGLYNCTVHFAETYSEHFEIEGARVFEVSAGGDSGVDPISVEVDVMKDLEGAEFTAYTKTFTYIQAVSKISIREKPLAGDGFLAGFNCVYAAPFEIATAADSFEGVTLDGEKA